MAGATGLRPVEHGGSRPFARIAGVPHRRFFAFYASFAPSCDAAHLRVTGVCASLFWRSKTSVLTTYQL